MEKTINHKLADYINKLKTDFVDSIKNGTVFDTLGTCIWAFINVFAIFDGVIFL